jgi:NosL protein
MKRLALSSVVGAVLLGGMACTTVRPIPIAAGDVCSRCRRPIVETSLAGEVITANLYASKYRTPACMAQYLIEHPQEAVEAVYVTDYTTGRLFDAENAHFVKTEVDPFTHETDFAAFMSSSEAIAFGAPTGFRPVDWNGVKQFAAARVSGN